MKEDPAFFGQLIAVVDALVENQGLQTRSADDYHSARSINDNCFFALPELAQVYLVRQLMPYLSTLKDGEKLLQLAEEIQKQFAKFEKTIASFRGIDIADFDNMLREAIANLNLPAETLTKVLQPLLDGLSQSERGSSITFRHAMVSGITSDSGRMKRLVSAYITAYDSCGKWEGPLDVARYIEALPQKNSKERAKAIRHYAKSLHQRIGQKDRECVAAHDALMAELKALERVDTQEVIDQLKAMQKAQVTHYKQVIAIIGTMQAYAEFQCVQQDETGQFDEEGYWQAYGAFTVCMQLMDAHWPGNEFIATVKEQLTHCKLHQQGISNWDHSRSLEKGELKEEWFSYPEFWAHLIKANGKQAIVELIDKCQQASPLAELIFHRLGQSVELSVANILCQLLSGEQDYLPVHQGHTAIRFDQGQLIIEVEVQVHALKAQGEERYLCYQGHDKLVAENSPTKGTPLAAAHFTLTMPMDLSRKPQCVSVEGSCELADKIEVTPEAWAAVLSMSQLQQALIASVKQMPLSERMERLVGGEESHHLDARVTRMARDRHSQQHLATGGLMKGGTGSEVIDELPSENRGPHDPGLD